MTADEDENGGSPAAARDYRGVLLEITSGAVNAVSFLALGKVFSSVITGNLVLLGVAATTHSSVEAIHAGVALAGYAAGVLIGAPLAAPRSHQAGTWPASVTATLAAELVVLAGFSVGWELSDGSPHRGAQLVLLIGAAAGMGLQGAAAAPARRDVEHVPDQHARRGGARPGHPHQARRARPQPRRLGGDRRGRAGRRNSGQVGPCLAARGRAAAAGGGGG